MCVRSGKDFPFGNKWGKASRCAPAAGSVSESDAIDAPYCCRSLTRTCPRKGFFTMASPSQCLPWRCSNWASGGRRKRAGSSSSCSSLTPKELGKAQAGWTHCQIASELTLSVRLSRLSVQAVAATGQAAAAGDGRHRGQAASHGRQEAQRAQVGAHRVRQSHGASEPREREPELHPLQFYINFQIFSPGPSCRRVVPTVRSALWDTTSGRGTWCCLKGFPSGSSDPFF